MALAATASEMTLPKTADSNEAAAATLLVGKIPLRNIWLLMLYASELFRLSKRNAALQVEDCPDDVPDLVARILVKAVNARLRSNLRVGYVATEAVLNRVRGRVDLLATERRALLQRGKVACRVDAFTVDTPRNRFVKLALARIAARVGDRQLAHTCVSLARTMEAQGVVGEPPARRLVRLDDLGAHDNDDRLMVAAAMLAMDLALPTEDLGTRWLQAPERTGTWIRELFEKAVGGFFEVVLSNAWHVRKGRWMRWPVEQATAGVDAILPRMQTDIELNAVAHQQRIIIDTKFTSLIVAGYHRPESLRSGYLYQMYAYLRSQEHREDAASWSAAGVMLHPAVDRMIDESFVLQGHCLRFLTVDLAASSHDIRQQLLAVLETGRARI